MPLCQLLCLIETNTVETTVKLYSIKKVNYHVLNLYTALGSNFLTGIRCDTRKSLGCF